VTVVWHCLCWLDSAQLIDFFLFLGRNDKNISICEVYNYVEIMPVNNEY